MLEEEAGDSLGNKGEQNILSFLLAPQSLDQLDQCPVESLPMDPLTLSVD